jgi:hypothetical protein
VGLPEIALCLRTLSKHYHIDCMVYLGTWEPVDFYRHAPDGDGSALFARMGPKFEKLWDWAIDARAGDTIPTSWSAHAGCYAFRCRHCGVLRAHCDWH